MVEFSKYSAPRIPMRFNLSGDKERSKSLINYAKQQVGRMLEINNANRFNQLSQQIQNKHMKLPSGEAIDIQVNHGLIFVNINSPIITPVTPKEILEEPKEKLQQLGMVNVLAATSYYASNEAAWLEDLALWNSYGGASALIFPSRVVIQTGTALDVVAPYGLPDGLDYVNFYGGDDVEDSWTDLQYWTERVGSIVLQNAPSYAMKIYAPLWIVDSILFSNGSIRSAFQNWLTANGLLWSWDFYTSGVFIIAQQRWLKVLAENSYWSI
jgi:hypothetical protein